MRGANEDGEEDGERIEMGVGRRRGEWGMEEAVEEERHGSAVQERTCEHVEIEEWCIANAWRKREGLMRERISGRRNVERASSVWQGRW